MKLAAALLTSLALCLAAHGCSRRAGPDPARDGFPSEQARVAETVRGLFDAAGRLDAEAVETLHLYGPKFSKFDEWGLGREDAARTRAAEKADLARLKSFATTIRELKVDVFGPAAVATFLIDYVAETEQGRFARTLRSTLVLANDGSGWRIVHEHFSPLVQA